MEYPKSIESILYEIKYTSSAQQNREQTIFLKEYSVYSIRSAQ